MPFISEPDDRPVDPFVSIYGDEKTDRDEWWEAMRDKYGYCVDSYGLPRDRDVWYRRAGRATWQFAKDAVWPFVFIVSFMAFVFGIYSLGYEAGEATSETCVQQDGNHYVCAPTSQVERVTIAGPMGGGR